LRTKEQDTRLILHEHEDDDDDDDDVKEISTAVLSILDTNDVQNSLSQSRIRFAVAIKGTSLSLSTVFKFGIIV
jgi:hypothetical protein